MANGRGPMSQTDYAYLGPYQLFALQWPTIILHFKFKMIKKYLISSYLASRQPCVRLKRPATWGPNYMRWQFFHKRYPLNFDFVRENVLKSWDWPSLSRLADTTFVQNGPHCRAPNTWVSNFFNNTDLHWILILWKIQLKYLQIGT